MFTLYLNKEFDAIVYTVSPDFPDSNRGWPMLTHSVTQLCNARVSTMWVKDALFKVHIFLIAVSVYSALWATIGKHKIFFYCKERHNKRLLPLQGNFPVSYIAFNEISVLYKQGGNTLKGENWQHKLTCQPNSNFLQKDSQGELLCSNAPGFLGCASTLAWHTALAYTAALNPQRKQWPHFKVNQPSLSLTNQIGAENCAFNKSRRAQRCLCGYWLKSPPFFLYKAGQ